jgi:thiosulfate reductase cytochrome b subunit
MMAYLLLPFFILSFVMFSMADDQIRVKRQGGATVLTKAWNEALPGVRASSNKSFQINPI